MLDGLANSLYLQQGDFSSEKSSKLVGEKYTQFSKVIDRLFLLDKNNIVKHSISLLLVQRGLFWVRIIR